MKKLLNILSILSLTSICSLSLVSCKQQLPQFSLQKEKVYVVKAINYYETQNNKNLDLNKVQISDILSTPSISFKFKNNLLQFTYDVKLKNYFQSQNFISQKYKYINPEINGCFTLKNKNIINSSLNLLENLNNDYKNFLPHTDLLVGNTNDFIAIFNADDWSVISDSIFMGYTVIDYINNELGLKNPNINLTENDWIDIDSLMLHSSLGDSVKPGYSFLMHVVKIDGEFKILYTNLQSDSTTNMPYIDAGRKIQNNLTKIIENSYQFLLTKDILLELNDMFNYQQNLWTDNSIQNLINDKMWLTNANLNEAIKNLKILFTDQNNLNVINQLFNDNVHDSFAINIINNKASIDYPNLK